MFSCVIFFFSLFSSKWILKYGLYKQLRKWEKHTHIHNSTHDILGRFENMKFIAEIVSLVQCCSIWLAFDCHESDPLCSWMKTPCSSSRAPLLINDHFIWASIFLGLFTKHFYLNVKKIKWRRKTKNATEKPQTHNIFNIIFLHTVQVPGEHTINTKAKCSFAFVRT